MTITKAQAKSIADNARQFAADHPEATNKEIVEAYTAAWFGTMPDTIVLEAVGYVERALVA